MIQFSITAPALIVTLSPMVVGPWMTACGSITQFLPILTNSEHSRICWPSYKALPRTLNLKTRLSLRRFSKRAPRENKPNTTSATKICTHESIAIKLRKGTWNVDRHSGLPCRSAHDSNRVREPRGRSPVVRHLQRAHLGSTTNLREITDRLGYRKLKVARHVL